MLLYTLLFKAIDLPWLDTMEIAVVCFHAAVYGGCI